SPPSPPTRRSSDLAPTARGSRHAITPRTSRGSYCVTSPLLVGVPSAASCRRLHARSRHVIVAPSGRCALRRSRGLSVSSTSGLRNAPRHLVLVWRTGFPHAHFPVPGTCPSLVDSGVVGPRRVRRCRSRFGGLSWSHGWWVAAHFPEYDASSSRTRTEGRSDVDPGVLVRRCAAWALRAGGFAVDAVRVAADRSRVAGSGRSRSG